MLNLQILSLSLGYFLVILITVLALYHFWFQSTRYAKLGNRLPGYRPLPIIGHAYLAINTTPTNTTEVLIKLCKGKGDVLRFWFGNRLGVMINDPRDVELILGSNTHLEKTKEYQLFEPWLGDGLLISKGERWKTHRKIIVPTFHHSILKTFIPTFNKNGSELVEKLRTEVVGRSCDIHEYMGGATVDILLETVMGVKKANEEKSSFKYAKAVMDMCSILHYRHVRLWMRPDFIFKLTKMFKEQVSYLKIIHNLTERVIKNKKMDYYERVKQGGVSLYNEAVKQADEDLKEVPTCEVTFQDDLDQDEDIGGKKRLAFLDFLVEASHTEEQKLSDTEIRDEVNTIMFEGHDTTAAGISFCICLLGIHLEIQERVYQEMKSILLDSDRPVTLNDLAEMKYLERVILETLRLYPPVPLIGRIIREDVKLISGDYILPKNTSVGIAPYLVHRNADFYPNPEVFDPDNFLPERCQHRPFYSFIPFSAGPRSCVGRKYAMLKMKVLLAHVIRNFKITSLASEKDFQLQGDIILKRADGFMVILENRI